MNEAITTQVMVFTNGRIEVPPKIRLPVGRV